MNIRTAYVSFALLCGFSSLSRAQAESSGALVAIDHYTLHVAIDEGRHLLRGEALVQLHLMKDSVSSLHFELGSSASLMGVRDTSNKKIGSVEELQGTEKTKKEVSLSIPDSFKR